MRGRKITSGVVVGISARRAGVLDVGVGIGIEIWMRMRRGAAAFNPGVVVRSHGDAKCKRAVIETAVAGIFEKEQADAIPIHEGGRDEETEGGNPIRRAQVCRLTVTTNMLVR